MEKTDSKKSIFKYMWKIAAVVALAALILVAVTYYFPKNIGDKTVTVLVKQGDSFNGVTGQLVDGGVLSSRVMLKIPARIFGVDKRLIPGRYDFTGKNSYSSVLKKLGQGDFVRIKITIPEGATIWEKSPFDRLRTACPHLPLRQFNLTGTHLKGKVPWGGPPRHIRAEYIQPLLFR